LDEEKNLGFYRVDDFPFYRLFIKYDIVFLIGKNDDDFVPLFWCINTLPYLLIKGSWLIGWFGERSNREK